MLELKPLPKGREHQLAGDVVCPPDKSVTHRSVIFAAMAKGVSTVQKPLLGADCRSTMGVFRALGVKIDVKEDAVKVDSPGWDRWRSPDVPLDYGNSGTTARLLTGVFAASDGLFTTAWGDPSLSKRPMGRVVIPMRAVGAKIMGRDDGKLLPLAIHGAKLRPGEHLVDKASAQVKSAIILAGLNIDGKTSVRLPKGGRDHSERMLKALGAKIETRVEGKQEIISVKGPFRPQPRTYRVPGDPSSAAFLVALGAIAGGKMLVRGVLDNPTRTGFLTLIERFGVKLERSDELADPNAIEPMRDLTVHGGAALKPVDMEPELAPTLIDEIPILAVVALFAKGESRFRGLEELRVKESDRLAKTIELITLAGGKARAEGDDLLVTGGIAQVTPFSYDPDYDHRLAMAAGVLAQFAGGPCFVKDPDCVAVSFPGFFDVLSSLR